MAECQGIDLLRQRLTAKKSAGEFGFDPASIIAIITAIVNVIQNCKQPTPANLKRRLFNRAKVAMALMKEDSNLTFFAARAQADELFDMADSASDVELQSLIADCQ